jgi:hypothetical protein
MNIEPFRATDVTEADSVKLRRFTTPGGVYWKQDWPCYAAAHEAHQGDYFEEAQK